MDHVLPSMIHARIEADKAAKEAARHARLERTIIRQLQELSLPLTLSDLYLSNEGYLKPADSLCAINRILRALNSADPSSCVVYESTRPLGSSVVRVTLVPRYDRIFLLLLIPLHVARASKDIWLNRDLIGHLRTYLLHDVLANNV